MANTPDTRDLRLDHFTACLEDEFHLDVGDGGKLSVQLVEAAEMPTAKRIEEGQRREFSLLFKGPSEPALEQGMYPLHHGRVGNHALFLVPVNQDDDGRYYEAVFT